MNANKTVLSKIRNIKIIEILDDFVMILRISSFSKHCKIVKKEIGNIMLLFKESNIKEGREVRN